MTSGSTSAAASGAAAVPALAGFTHGPSAEMRRFSAGFRTVIALLCTMLLLATEPALPRSTLVVLLGYALWAAYVLWREASGRPNGHTLSHYWVDVICALVALQTADTGNRMFAVTLVQPVVLASIGYGTRHGVLLALVGAVGLLLDPGLNPDNDETWVRALPSLGVFALVPVAALLARPMSVMRRRLALITELGVRLDPRRGLEGLTTALVESLRSGTEARVAVLVMPESDAAPTMIATAEEGSFPASDEVRQQLGALLAMMPAMPVWYARRRWAGLRGGVRAYGAALADDTVAGHLADAARLLDAESVVAVPIMRYEHRHALLLMGYADTGSRTQDMAALWHAAPEIFRLIEQAALVDQLQEESAAHERSRIGRDLHDSAIQPYLGLKYAVESVALRIPEDNPARGEVDGLLELVNAEVGALRELISGLRAGEPGGGDNALVPALRRQVRRFSLLFDIDVRLDCPDRLTTSRALAGAVFHMVNEAMNNVRKHTQARCIWITVLQVAGGLQLRVRDDAAAVRGRALEMYVPRSLTERAEALGGAVVLSRVGGQDIEVVIDIPFQNPQGDR